MSGMFVHNLRLGAKSLRRNPVLTALMIMSIGIGVAASMITYAVFRAVSGNPIPQKSSVLFVPQIDNWGPTYNRAGEPPPALNYTDAMALMKAKKAERQTVFFPISASVISTTTERLPFKVRGYATFGDFFPMFEVPFLYGSGWSHESDDAHEAVAVISKELNKKLFDGANSVGKDIQLDDGTYRIVGVTDTYDPKPRFFDMFNSDGYTDPAQVYVPFHHMMDLKVDTWGNNTCGGGPNRGNDYQSWLRGECVWLAAWVELPTKADEDAYRSWLRGYAEEQQRSGRFGWAPNVRLRNVVDWLDYRHAVPPESRIALTIAVSFLIICLVNTVGLLLAKFMRRAPEIGVRRALGASRAEIYKQFLAEAGMVGLSGGVLGLILTGAGMFGTGLVFGKEIAKLAQLDFSLVLLTLVVAVLSTLIAAFYPTWRAAQVQPAWQLKSN